MVLAALVAGIVLLGRDGAPDDPPTADPAPTEAGAQPVRLRGGGTAAETGSAAKNAHPADPRWRLTGRVRTKDGAAIPQADVWVELVRGGVGTIVATGKADTQGQFALDLEPLRKVRPLERASCTLVVAARKAGYVFLRDDEHYVRWHQRAGTWPIENDVVLSKGHALRGRVVDEYGEPVTRGHVRLRIDGKADAHVAAPLDPTGAYEWHIERPWTLTVAYKRDAIGRGETGPIDVDPSRDTNAPLLQLETAGEEIAGTARFVDGAPAAGVAIQAHWLSPKQGEATFEEILTQLGSAAGGWRNRSVDTDAFGRFVIRDLVPGRYEIQAIVDRDASAAEVLSGDADAKITIHKRRVRFLVVDESGALVRGAGCLMRFNLDQPIPDVSAVTLQSGRHVLEHWGEAGEPVEFAASADGTPYTTVATTVPSGRYDAEETVVLRPSTAPARVQIKLRKPDGSTFEHFEAEVSTVIADAPVIETRFKSGKDVVLTVPHAAKDEYVLTVRPEHDAHPARMSTWFPIATRIGLAPGETTAVDLVSKQGGRLRLTLRDVRLQKGAWVPYDLEVVPRGGRARKLGAFTRPRGDGWSRGGLRASTPSVCNDLLEPGDYMLRAKFSKLQSVSVPLRIEAGQVTDTTLDIPRDR